MSISTILDSPPDLLDDSIALADEVRRDEYLSWASIAFVCPNLACDGRRGEKPHREMIDPHSRQYTTFDVPCGYCTKQMIEEDDYRG